MSTKMDSILFSFNKIFADPDRLLNRCQQIFQSLIQIFSGTQAESSVNVAKYIHSLFIIYFLCIFIILLFPKFSLNQFTKNTLQSFSPFPLLFALLYNIQLFPVLLFHEILSKKICLQFVHSIEKLYSYMNDTIILVKEIYKILFFILFDE